jgi:hypothetical protein
MVFGLGTITLHNSFADSTIVVYNNVAKQVLFKLGALLLQLFIYKIFALIASSRRAFTSYLMFTEDYIQKTLYIFSRGFSSGGIILLLLTISLFVGTWFDAVLWALDSPGYIARKANVTAATIANNLLPEPGYLVFSSSAVGDVASLDAQIVDIMGANLFEPGVNFSLTGTVDPSTPKTVAATQPFAKAGPRIWLDHDGFSVSADRFTTYSPDYDNVTARLECPWQTTSDTVQRWNCTFNNSFAAHLALQNTLGLPEIHWDDVTDSRLQTQYISPTREDNPWKTLGTGGDTALMKQMFTVTKDKMRHTFIGSAIKFCMLTDYDVPFTLEEVTDLVKRAWSTNPAKQTNPIISRVAKSIIEARSLNSSGVYGLTAETESSVSQVNYELLNVQDKLGVVRYSLFRASVVNITLVRSDELPEPVAPLEPCLYFYSNIALGGKVRETDCYLSIVGNQTQNKLGARFFGQVDTSSFLILNGIMGDGRSNYSDKALNQAASEWAVTNDDKLNNLVLSRGALLALGPETVTVEITTLRPAISKLQIVLIASCAVLAGVSWLSVIFFAEAHYSSSLLASLIATTMGPAAAADGEMSTKTRRKPRYLVDGPEIFLTDEDVHGVVMTTERGMFRHVGLGGEGKDGGSEDANGLAKRTTVSQYEVVRDRELDR